VDVSVSRCYNILNVLLVFSFELLNVRNLVAQERMSNYILLFIEKRREKPMAKKAVYSDVYLFTGTGIYKGLCSLQWNKVFLHFMAGNKKFFSIRLDTIKREKEYV